MSEKIGPIHSENYGIYGVRKIHTELRRKDMTVARWNGSCGPRPAWYLACEGPRTTKPAPETGRPSHLVERRSPILRISARSPAGSTQRPVIDVFSPPGRRLEGLHEPRHRSRALSPGNGDLATDAG
ncbi:hypothetical protein AB6813_03195 [bacterium RCC_150]